MLNSLGINKPPKETTVCVAMSGGVDSSAAAYMLKKEGYNVFGLTMDLLQPPYAPEVSTIADAKIVADQLGIIHHTLDFKKDFAKDVVSYFAESYLSGETPSPCIICNKQIKLGLLADKARELGADILVTGHYAEIKITENGVELHRAKDLLRDQSYFLFGVDKKTLQMLRLPLSNYTKDQTREIVKEAGLSIYKKPDSQDICFVSNGKYSQLINKLKPNSTNPGDIVYVDGRIIGKHKGLINYTIGQRRGLGIGGGDILFVIKLDPQKNQVIVGPFEALKQKTVYIKDINWLGEGHPDTMELSVKLRSRQDIVPATVIFKEKNTAEVILTDDFYGIAPGQGCCFYEKNRVLGGGFITKQEKI